MTTYNPQSFFPDNIDELIFFHDVDIEHAPIMDHYQALIEQTEYDKANEYLSRQEGVHGYFAELFHAIESRIANLQRYLLTKSQTNNPMDHGENEPIKPQLDDIWVGI